MATVRIINDDTGSERLLFTDGSPFSNAYVTRFVRNGIRYFSAEQYIQAKKALMFGDRAAYDKIMTRRCPDDAKKLGSELVWFNIARWNRNHDQYLAEAVWAKFSDNPELRIILTDTKLLPMVYANAADAYLGSGMDIKDDGHKLTEQYPGKNKLGHKLMATKRALLRRSV